MTFSDFIAAGVDLCFVGAIGNSGYLLGSTTTAPTAGDPAGSAMMRVKGVIGADINIADPDVVDIPGDNGSQGAFVFDPTTQPAFTMEKGVFQMLLQALAQGTTTYDDGDVKMGVLQPGSPVRADLGWILQGPTKKKGTGVEGLKAWSGYIVPISQAFPRGRNGFQTRQGASEQMRIVPTVAGQLWDGLAIDETNFEAEDGAPVIFFTSDYPIVYQTWVSDGAEDTYTLAYTPASAATVRVRVDGVLKALTTDYTINLSTNELTWEAGHIPADEAIVVARIGMAG